MATSRSQRVKDFAASLPPNEVFISAASMGEIRKGLFNMEEGARKRQMSQFAKEILEYNPEQIASIDVDTAMI